MPEAEGEKYEKGLNLKSFVDESDASLGPDGRVLQLLVHQRPEPRVEGPFVGVASAALDPEVADLAESRNVLRQRRESVSDDGLGRPGPVPGIEDVGVKCLVENDDGRT